MVVPTRNRPDRLRRCLEALADARANYSFGVLVCDSSSGDAADEVADICAEHDFVELIHHDRNGAAAARNVGVRACGAELMVSLDDDVYVEPEAIARLAAAVTNGDVVAAGTLDWGDRWSRPLVMRRLGYARDAVDGEATEWVISAVLCCPRALVMAVPWDEDRRYYDDRMTCLLWRRAGARFAFVEDARARHDDEQKAYPLAQERHRIYANAFDAVFLRHSVGWLVSFELLGFAASARRFARSPRGALGILVEWLRGNARFVADLPRLRRGASAPAPR